MSSSIERENTMQTELEYLVELLHDEVYDELTFELIDNEMVDNLLVVAQAVISGDICNEYWTQDVASAVGALNGPANVL